MFLRHHDMICWWLLDKTFLHWVFDSCPGASIVHAYGTGELQANPPVAVPWLSRGYPLGSLFKEENYDGV